MAIEKKAFVPYRTQEERDKDKSQVTTIRFNNQELKELSEVGQMLGEYKLTTLVKSMLKITLFVLQQPFMGYVLQLRLKNEERNKKKNIDIEDINFRKL